MFQHGKFCCGLVRLLGVHLRDTYFLLGICLQCMRLYLSPPSPTIQYVISDTRVYNFHKVVKITDTRTGTLARWSCLKALANPETKVTTLKKSSANSSWHKTFGNPPENSLIPPNKISQETWRILEMAILIFRKLVMCLPGNVELPPVFSPPHILRSRAEVLSIVWRSWQRAD